MYLGHLRGDEGASSVEYGLIVVAVAALIVGVIFTVGLVVGDSYRDSCGKVRNEVTQGLEPEC